MDPTTLEFTPLRISTLVTTGHLGTTINLANLFKQIKILMIPIGYPKEGILKMEHETNVVGYSARDLLTKKKGKLIKNTRQQATTKNRKAHIYHI